MIERRFGMQMKVSELIKRSVSMVTRRSINELETLIFDYTLAYIMSGNIASELLQVENRRYIYMKESKYFFDENMIIDIKLYKHQNGFNKFLTRELDSKSRSNVQVLLDQKPELSKIVFVLNFEDSELTHSVSKRLLELQNLYPRLEIICWNLEILDIVFNKNYEKISNQIEKIEESTFANSVKKAVKDIDYIDINKEKLIKKLQENYLSDDLVLFLGAGVSKGADIPTWNELITDMFVYLLGDLMSTESYELNEKEKKKILKHFNNSHIGAPLLQARYLKTGLNINFEKVLIDLLYKDCTYESALINEIVKLCAPRRSAIGLFAIVNYNFDDLMEINLINANIDYKSISHDADYPDKDQLGIYHVHGYLPKNNEIAIKDFDTEVVFSEDGYHRLYKEPYHWSNLIQLNFLLEKKCLFIGLSMQDPNLRRLLDISNFKKEDSEQMLHTVILKRDIINGTNKNSNKTLKAFERANQGIQEEYFSEMGVNVIWIDSYDEIPLLIKEIREQS